MRMRTAIAAAVVLLASGPARGEVSRTLKGELRHEGRPIAVENLAGTMQVTAADVAAVTVEAVVHAEDGALADAVTLDEVTGEDGRATLRVRYPVDRHESYCYPEGSGSSEVRYDGRRVRVSSRRGVLLWADVTVKVPRREIDGLFRNVVGSLDASGLAGEILLDAASGGIHVRDSHGDIKADTGSGGVEAEGLQGTFTCDTGSGGCRIRSFDGERLVCDTGSGGIVARDVKARSFSADTGSGGVRLEDADVEEISADTGSGGVTLEVVGSRLRRVDADTGSGHVMLTIPAGTGFLLRADVGSGGVDSRFSDAQPILDGRTVVGWERGDRAVRINVDTGSGGVTVAPGS